MEDFQSYLMVETLRLFFNRQNSTDKKAIGYIIEEGISCCLLLFFFILMIFLFSSVNVSALTVSMIKENSYNNNLYSLKELNKINQKLLNDQLIKIPETQIKTADFKSLEADKYSLVLYNENYIFEYKKYNEKYLGISSEAFELIDSLRTYNSNREQINDINLEYALIDYEKLTLKYISDYYDINKNLSYSLGLSLSLLLGNNFHLEEVNLNAVKDINLNYYFETDYIISGQRHYYYQYEEGNSRGGSLDLYFNTRFKDKYKFDLLIENIFAYIDWNNNRYIDFDINTNTGNVDVDGNINYAPIGTGSWQDTELNWELPLILNANLKRDFNNFIWESNYIWKEHHISNKFNKNIWLWENSLIFQNENFENSIAYEVNNNLFSLKHKNNFFSIKVGLDSLLPDNIKNINFDIVCSLTF